MNRGLLSLILFCLGLPALALAHTDPPAQQDLSQGMPVAADPDTVTAHLILPEEAQLPVAMTLRPDTLLLGRDAFLELEFNLDEMTTAEDLVQGLEMDEPWFHWDGTSTLKENRILVLPIKIYQINPFKVALGELETPVYLVDLSTESTQETAGIRDPRRWGWNLFTILFGALVATALALLGWWAWTARKVATEKLPQWDVPPPGWMPFCLDLEKLYRGEALSRGESSAYLDRLAALCRRYLAARFRVGAMEMTGPEVKTSCANLGLPAVDTDPFVEILNAVDSHRYNPEPTATDTCRRKTGQLFQAVARVRILPKYTPVDAGQLVEAEQCWSRLSELESELMASSVEDFSPERSGGSR